MRLINADKVIRDIEERYDIPNMAEEYAFNKGISEMKNCVLEVLNNAEPVNAIPIPDNATNGDVIKAMFGYDKVSEFMGYVRIMARVGNWFNDGVVAEFDKDWWNALYEGSDTE